MTTFAGGHALIVAAAIAGGCASVGARDVTRPAEVRVPGAISSAPLVLVNFAPMVKARIGGQPFWFLIDTGTSVTLLSRTAAERLGLERRTRGLGVELRGREQGLAPQTVDVPGIELGSAQFGPFTAIVDDFPGPERFLGVPIGGTLSLSLFAEVLVTLDHDGRRLIIEASDLLPANGRDRLALHDHQGVPTVELLVGGRRVDALLDSGAGALLTLPSDATRQSGEAVWMGSHKIEGTAAPATDGLARLGAPILRRFIATFDQRNHVIRLVRRVPPGAS